MHGDRATGLLWALELLAWYPEHLTRTTLLLGKLARKHKRPKDILRAIFLTWLPQTGATVPERNAALTLLLLGTHALVLHRANPRGAGPCNDIDAIAIARYEWAYLPLLREERNLRLHDHLANAPDLFAEMIKSVYRPANQQVPPAPRKRRLRGRTKPTSYSARGTPFLARTPTAASIKNA